jgi:hypothetical protein
MEPEQIRVNKDRGLSFSHFDGKGGGYQISGFFGGVFPNSSVLIVWLY